MRNFIITFLALLVVCGAWQPVQAQEENDFIIDNVISQQTDEYKPMIYENLAKMYWAIRKFNLDNDEALEEFIRIVECPLYKNYYQNEFEWEKIKSGMREYIKKNIILFPTKLEAIVPIELGRYDVDQQAFLVEQKDTLFSATRVSLGQYWPGIVCDNNGIFKNYPTGIVLMLSRPFTLEKVPVERELAKIYLDEVSLKYASTPINYKREVYVRLKLQVSRYRRDIYVEAGSLYSEVFATLEGFEVYADKDKEKLMYEKDLKPRVRRYIRKRKAGENEEGQEQEQEELVPESGSAPE